ncbi:MAG: polysaccharide deacetylase family protein [Clostridiaceae bacterium]|jgi:peptidoglycan-N-acetylmuramic acid deacetylase|nr:polysaccharide deacetylase family protein [Clostridiaceae bacterium]
MRRKGRRPKVAINRYVSILIVSTFLSLTLSGCSSIYTYNHELSDLGGVYASSFSDLDLETEISGRLSESDTQNNLSKQGSSESDWHRLIGQVADGNEYSNKLLRWGISRRSNHEVPAADPGAPELLKKYGSVYIGEASQSTIYLTFDEGYENGYTPMILDTLRDNNVRAVFFITGPYLNGHQDLVRRMIEEGHIVGNHTIHHPSLPELPDNQLEEEVLGLERAFKEKFNQNMYFIRPPKGEYSERTLALTHKLGYCNLFWSFAYDDWYRDKNRGSQYAYDIVMRNLHNGAVLLLHAVSKDNAEALDKIIKDAIARGFTIGDPQELYPSEKTGI